MPATLQHYSSREEIEAFIKNRINEAQRSSDGFHPSAANTEPTPERRPLFVLDLDGNILAGYRLTSGRVIPDAYPKRDNSNTLPGILDPDKQTIPYDADIEALEQQGIIEPSLLAGAAMDVRLPNDFVDTITGLQKKGKAAQIAILTSRGMDDAKQIMHASGIENFEQFILAADSAATMYIDGKFHHVHETTPEEAAFTQNIDGLQEKLNAAAFEVVGSTRQKPWIEQKTEGLATNVHYRKILDELGLEGDARAAMDDRLRTAIKKVLEEYVRKSSPRKENGEPVYSLLNGPETIEVKHPAVNKGNGLRFIVEQARKSTQPSAIIYAGDDVTKTDRNSGIVTPGTDYYAFRVGHDIAEETGIPFYAIHTLHPADKRLLRADSDAHAEDVEADDTCRIRPVTGQEDPRIGATVTTASPLQTVHLVTEIIQAIDQKLEPQIGRSSGRSL
jgi:trehalose-phosphatase